MENAVKNNLFSVIKAEIKKSDTKKALDKSEIEKVYRLADSHDLGHFVGEYVINNELLKVDDPLYIKMRRTLMISVFRLRQLGFIFDTVCDLLEKNGIDFIPLKGAVLRKAYPADYMRTSSDVDILIKEKDIKAAVNAIESNTDGKAQGFGMHDVTIEFENGFSVELHYTLDGSGIKIKNLLPYVWTTAVLADGFKHKYELCDEVFYCYHISHMAKHVKNGGCGIKPFIDLFLLNEDDTNAKMRQKLLCECGLDAFSSAVNRLCQSWFSGNDVPKDLEKLENLILLSGVYGVEANVTHKEKLFRFDRIFFSPTKLSFFYPNLKKYPFLYPVYFIRRCLRLLFYTLPKVAFSKLFKKTNADTKSAVDSLKI